MIRLPRFSGFRIADDTAGDGCRFLRPGSLRGDRRCGDGYGFCGYGSADGRRLFDLNRHEVLYARNIHERLNPAA